MADGWTDERVERLKRLTAQNLSASVIAQYFGDVTRNAVLGKQHRLGIAPSQKARRSPSITLASKADEGELLTAWLNAATTQAEEIKILRDAGWTYHQITQAIGAAPGTIANVCRSMA